MKTLLVSAVALIDVDGRVLLAQRPVGKDMAGLWEFPGGRLEGEESPAQAAVREILEETGWQVRLYASYRTVTHYYTRYRVTLHSFICDLVEGQSLQPSLNAASHYAWVDAAALLQYPFPAGHRQLVAALNRK